MRKTVKMYALYVIYTNLVSEMTTFYFVIFNIDHAYFKSATNHIGF